MIGPNGSGKSTLLATLGNREAPGIFDGLILPDTLAVVEEPIKDDPSVDVPIAEEVSPLRPMVEVGVLLLD